LEKKQLKQGMKKQIKEPVTTDLVGVLGQEVLKVLTLGGGGVTGEGNQETLINPMNFVEDPENKGQDVIKELCRNVLLQKIEKFDNENLVLKNEIKTLRFALEACQEKNDVQSGDYEEQIKLADSEISELEGYRDNAEMLVKQVNAMHQQLHYMINPSEYEKMEARVNMLNRRILKFKSQRDCLLVEKNELGEQTDQLKFQLRLERQHKANSEERMENEARLCNNYRDKFLALEKKFDAYTKRTIQEQRRILFEYGYQVKDNAFQDKSLTVKDLKDRIVKLELVVKEKEDQLMQISSVERKEENARSLLDEVQIQMNRMTEANNLYHEEEKLLQKEYEVQAERALNNRINELNVARQGPSKEAYRECNKLKKQIKNLQNEKKGLQVLVDEKDHTLKVMAMNQGHICTPDGRDRSKCEHCKEGTHVVSERIRKKLMFPFRHGESRHQHHHKHSIKSQIVVNPDAKIPTVSQKQREEYEAFVKKNKRQLFRIQEAERAAKILYKEIQDRFSEKDQQKGKSMVEQLATTLVKMMTDLKDFSSENNIVVDDDSDAESSQGNMRAQTSELSAMKNRLERQTAHYEGRLKKAMDGIDVLQQENNKLMKHNQQYEKCLVEAKERSDKDKQIKQRQRAMLGNIQKQRDELQVKLDGAVTTKQQVSSSTTTSTTGTFNQSSQGSQTEHVVREQGYEDYEQMKNELEELRDRNKDLEEYYNENTKKTNNAHKVVSENEKLRQTVQQLQAQLEAAQLQLVEQQQKQPIKVQETGPVNTVKPIKVVQETSDVQQKQPIDVKETDHEEAIEPVTSDHLCYTGGCDEATQKPSDPDVVVSLSPQQQDDVKPQQQQQQQQQQFIVTLGEPVLSDRKKKKSAVPEWMKWDEKKKKEEQEKKEKEAAEKEDGGIIHLEPKQQVRHGRRQMAN